MRNIKGFAIAADGNLKRIAITFDEVDESTGKIIKGNVKINRVITGETILAAIKVIEDYTYEIVSAE